MAIAKINISLLTLIAVLIVVGLFSAHPAAAHKGATGVVKERMDLMKSIGDNMKALAAIFKAAGQPDANEIKKSARAIKGHAEKVPSLFPKGSLKHPSEAKASIWKDWDAFEQSANRLATYADALEASAGNTDETGNIEVTEDPVDTETLKTLPPKVVFSQMAKVCKSCHEQFRQKKH